MKRLFILLMPVMMLGLTACGDQLTPEQAEEAVLQGERDRLPLLKQEMAYFASDITIDSMHITIAEEPMQGYLYTTWISNGKQRTETPIIVVVDSIRSDETRKGYIQWLSRWDAAAKSYLMKGLSF